MTVFEVPMKRTPFPYASDGTIIAEELYLPRAENLKRGDVLLTRNANSRSRLGIKRTSWIQRFTKSKFSHALICTVPPLLTEAVGEGVKNVTFGRCYVFDLRNVLALRYHDAEISAAAGEIASQALAQRYSKKKIAALLVPALREHALKDDGTFCSALVCWAFKEAGAPEFSAIDEFKITPGDLARLPGFSDITSSLFFLDLPPPNAESLNPLDGDRVDSLSDLQVAYYQQGLLVFQKYFERIQRIDAAIEYPKTFDAGLKHLVRRLHELRGGPPSNASISLLALYSEIDEKIFEILDKSSLATAAESLKAEENDGLNYYFLEAFKPNPDIAIQSVLSVHATTPEQIDIREAAIRSYDQYEHAESKTVDWLIKYTKIVQAHQIERYRKIELLLETLRVMGHFKNEIGSA